MAVPLTLSSVPAQTPYAQYVSGSSQTVFPYPFEITQDSDLVCLINGVQQVTDSGYTLSGQGTTVGGNLTFTLGQTAGTIITLYRNISIARITQLSQNGTFFSANFNNEYNRIYLILQQLQQSLLPGGNQAFALMVPNSNNPAPTTLLTPTNYANKYLSFDGNGNPQPAALTSSGSITASLIGGFIWPQSSAEAANSIIPSVQYPYGSLRRYGADPTGIASSSTALANALLCNSYVWDDFPGGGTYLFNTQVSVTNYPFRLQGQAPDATGGGLTGTIFKLGNSAASLLFLGGFIANSIIDGIGFLVASGGAGQYLIYGNTSAASVNCQWRNVTIQNCLFQGVGVGDTSVGIYLDSTGTYSAFNTIQNNYFASLSGGILFSGTTTPNLILNNKFLGYTGAGSTKAGSAIQVNSGGSETKIAFNYCEGWVNGVYLNGAVACLQEGNDYEVCTNGYNWVANGSGIIDNTSLGEVGVGGTYSGQSSLDGSQMQLSGRLGWLATGGAIQSTRGFQEGDGPGTNLRTAAMGYHTTTAPTMTANGGGSLASQTTNTFSYTQIGGSMFVDFNITAALTGSGTTVLSVPIPSSKTAIVGCENACAITNNSGTVIGVVSTAASGTAINFTLVAGGAFTAGTVGAAGQILIRTNS